MSHARPSFATVALLLGALGAFAGCGGSTSGGRGDGRGDDDKVAETAPCERLTVAMAERVLQSPKLQKPTAGVYGCSLEAVSTADRKDSQRDAAISLSTRQTPKKGAAPVAADIAELRKKTAEDKSVTTRDLAVGTDGFISFRNEMKFAVLAWTDDEQTYVLDYNAWMSPQQGKVPVDMLIAIAKDIASK